MHARRRLPLRPSHSQPSIACCNAGKIASTIGSGQWIVRGANGGHAWVVVHCVPERRTGLAQLDAWYGRFRQADGSPPAEIGSGRARIANIDGMRRLAFESRGTLVQGIACVPLEAPSPDRALRASVLEAPGGTFLIELLGTPSVVEEWSILFDHFVDSMRPATGPD